MPKEKTESEKRALVARIFDNARTLENVPSNPVIEVEDDFIMGYEIIGLRETGGTAEILDAFHYETGSNVVIKRPRSDYSKHFLPMLNSELINEARLINRINHPNIVSNVVDGTHHKPFAFDDKIHIPLEVITNNVLESLSDASLDQEFYKKMYSFMTLAVDAVRYLHDEIGVVHGDITPSQFMHTNKGQVRLCDLASAKDIGHKYKTFTVTDEYAAPARLRMTAKPEMDIYGLGKTFMRMFMQFTGASKDQRKKIFKEHKDDLALSLLEDAYVPTFLVNEVLRPSIGSIHGNGFTMNDLRNNVTEFAWRYKLRTQSEIKAPKLDQNFLDALGFTQGGPGYDRPLVHTSHL